MKKNDEKLSKFWIFRILWFFVFPFEISSVILDAGVITWQLHNQCTQGFLQSYLKHVDANGDMNSRCLTDFIVHTSPTGLIRLQHALSKVYICFNRRRQLITKLQSRRNKGCYFYERISEAGYTEIESAAEPGLFLGFNRKGYRQDPFTYWTRRKCFSFMKFERFVSREELRNCGRKRKKNRSLPESKIESDLNLNHILKHQILNQIRVRSEDLKL